ncbi:hypothetical protein ABFT23_03060 [Nocardioides sp. C4-1]|uniref:hypothetical protein n=1 Tax=Nocardioides sp. C4-1 TaxID=3151851 RepID=UPI003267AC67
MDDHGTDDNTGYWREYDIGPLGRLARALAHVLPFAGIGIAVAFVVVLLAGIVGEEGLLPELATPIDLLSRMTLGMIITFAYAGFGVAAVADSLRAVATRRALAAAVTASTDRLAAPHPHQVETLVLRQHLLLVGFLGATGAAALLMVVFGLVEGDLPVLALATAVLAGCVGGCVALVRLPSDRVRRVVAEHVSAHAEQTAWGRARASDRGDKPRFRPRGQAGGPALLGLAAVLGSLSAFVLQTYLYVRHPGTDSSPGARLAERQEYSAAGETVLDLGIWVSAGLAALGLLAAAAGGLVERTTSLAARRDLAARLDDPTASRPEKDVLVRYSEPRTADVSRLAGVLGGLLVVPSAAVLVLAGTDNDTFVDASTLFADLRVHGVVGLAVSITLLVGAVVVDMVVDARGLELRNRLMRRWPTVPRTPDEDSRRHAVRTRPTLRVGL